MRILALASLSLSCLFPCVSAAEKPNIILIFTDDHGWPDIGAVGIYDDLKTPHIDQLAADGARCTSGYVTAPQCVPSRGGLLAGRDQSRFGLETNGSSLDGFNAEQTIAERLKNAGYATGQIGKWHLGPVQEISNHGFDDVFAKNSNRPGFANYGIDGSDQAPGKEDTKMYHLDACSAAATAFIDRHAEESFFLYLAYRAPHVPLDAPDKYLKRFPGEMPERRRQALAMISAMDDGVGAIREKLESKGIAEKTLIFFIGDNGAPLKIHKLDSPGGGPGWDGSLNEPMNGEKGMLSEGGIRVPFVAAWPGKIPGGQVYDEPVISLDVAATAAALSGLGEVKGLDGVNLVPFLSREKEGSPHEQLFWRWSSQSAIREGDWKLLRGGNREYLYDLKADAEEQKNLLSENPEIAKRLRDKLQNWTRELDPPGFIGDKMSTVWEQYFDFYLDGKPVSQPNRKKEEATVQGWLIRNGQLKQSERALHLVDSNGKQRFAPFIANSRFAAKGPFSIAVDPVKIPKGAVSVQWREDGQKDFLDNQSAALAVDGEELRGIVPTKAKVIHLRVRFADATNVALRSIRLETEDGKILQDWNFVE
ncbi:sulfatase-like hydrolase/transferase [bacterium]|jgi:uncharacterized sulfatase|nr:sulfatase-like hydrolase/transferase [bacterium]